MPIVRRRVGRAQAHLLTGESRVPVQMRLPYIALVVVFVVAGVAIIAANQLPGSGGLAGAGASATPVGSGSEAPGSGPTDPAAPPPVPGHEVYGFVPYWEMDAGTAAHLARTDLSTLALFSVTHKANGAMATSQTGYKRITGRIGRRMIRDARERGTRVEIVYTSFGEKKNRAFYDRPEAQERWIEALVDFAEEHRLDGINVDVELLPADLIPAYGLWIGRLREALRERLPDAQVSVATTGGERGAAMALAASAAGADRIFIMGYDYHYPGSQPGASAPIDRFDGQTKDLVWTLDTYAAVGVPVERTLLGLPLYGVTWPVAGPGLGDSRTGRGDTWVPRRNLAIFEDDTFEPTYDPLESVEFYAVPADGEEPGAWNAVYYDSPRSLRPKLALADDRGLAGAGFWAIGYERGLPGYSELIAEFRAGELAITE